MLMTFNEFLNKRVQESPDKSAFIYDEVSYTWSEFNDLADKAGQYFYNRDVKKDCKVGLWAVNSIEWLIAFSGLVKIGAVPVLINTHYTENELKRAVEYADIKLMCYSFRDGGVAPDCGADVINLFDDFIGMIQDVKVSEELNKVKAGVAPDDTFTILFTSGTTSLAKGVMVSHNSMIKVAIDAAKIMHWDNTDVNCLALPLFHCFGLSTGFLASIACGSELVISKTTRTEEILGHILNRGCTILNGVPTMYFALVRNLKNNPRNISTLRTGIIAGAAVSYDDYKMISEVMGIKKLQMSYGQTESSPSITFSDYDDEPELKAKSVGKAIPDIELAIFDINTGDRCPVGIPGEIRIRGYNVMKGYYKLPEETSKTIDKDGWLHTGDLGRLDTEGNLYFEGRLKELIIRGGENISPVEIEEYIRHFQNVAQVKVVGVPAAFIQEKVVACIIPEEGCEVDTKGLDSYLREHLAKYKIPEQYLYLKEFPLNASGKIKLNDLKEIAIKNQD